MWNYLSALVGLLLIGNITGLATDPVLTKRCSYKTAATPTFINDFLDCTGYHVCENGLYLGSGNCAAGLFFDSVTEKCDYSHNVLCLECPAPGRQPIQGSCQYFTECFERDGFMDKCPEGHNFDGGLCKLKADAPCFKCPVISSTSIILLYPSDAGCNKYNKCMKDVEILDEPCTPDGFVFDVITNTCVDPTTPGLPVECAAPTQPACPPIGPGKIPFVCDTDAATPTAGDCEYYRSCYNGEASASEYRCLPAGETLFDFLTNTCVESTDTDICHPFVDCP